MGTNHWGGHYNFTTRDGLGEGAEWLYQFSADHVMQTPIKINLSPNQNKYTNTPNSPMIWLDANGEIEFHPSVTWIIDHYDKIDFVATQGYTLYDKYWRDNGIKYDEEFQWFSKLTTYLFNNYCDSGKIFLIQNWEGDNLIGKEEDITEDRLRNMADWLQARHDGVVEGRKDFSNCSMKVACGAEVNKLQGLKDPQIIDYVIPNCTLDFVSYSYYEWDKQDVANVQEGIDNLFFGMNVIYEKFTNITDYGLEVVGPTKMIIGEFGSGREWVDAEFVPRLKAEAASAGVRFAFFWNLINNEYFDDEGTRPMEFYLRRPNDTVADVLWHLTGVTDQGYGIRCSKECVDTTWTNNRGEGCEDILEKYTQSSRICSSSQRNNCCCACQKLDTMNGATGLVSDSGLCPMGYYAIPESLDGLGKMWAEPNPSPSRSIEDCADICDERMGCTSFQYAFTTSTSAGACATYTNGQSNRMENADRLNPDSSWRSCMKLPSPTSSPTPSPTGPSWAPTQMPSPAAPESLIEEADTEDGWDIYWLIAGICLFVILMQIIVFYFCKCVLNPEKKNLEMQNIPPPPGGVAPKLNSLDLPDQDFQKMSSSSMSMNWNRSTSTDYWKESSTTPGVSL